MPNLLVLKTSDAEMIVVSSRVVEPFKALKPLIENADLVKNDEKVVIPLLKVNSLVLRKIFKWINFRMQMPKDEYEFVQSYFDQDIGSICQILAAADYLQYDDLYNHCVEAMSQIFKGKTTEQLRGMLNVENDHTTAMKKRFNEAKQLSANFEK